MPTTVVVEPIPLATIPVDGIHRIEIKGNQVLFTFYEDQQSDINEGLERRLVTKLLFPIESLPDCIRQTLEAVADHALGAVTRKVQTALHMH